MKMEDDLNFFRKNRMTTSKKTEGDLKKMEHNLRKMGNNLKKMEDDLKRKWKMTSKKMEDKL
jgi:hypothetical protein